VLEKRVLYSRAIFLYIGRVFLWGLGSFAVRLDWVGWRVYGDYSVGPSVLYTFVETFEMCRGFFSLALLYECEGREEYSR